MPGLLGVVAACGLPGAMGYFVAGPDAGDPRLWPTVHVLMAARRPGVGIVAWLAAAAGASTRTSCRRRACWSSSRTGSTVATQLPVAVAKSSLQALGDARGSNVVTAAEEAAFVPAMILLWVSGLRGGWLLVGSLLIARTSPSRPTPGPGSVVGSTSRADPRGSPRSGSRRAGWSGSGCAARSAGSSTCSTCGSTVVILGALAGPGPVGVYVVASKYAELLRLPGLALTWVTYPGYARQSSSPTGLAARPGLPALPRPPRLPRLIGLGVLAAVLVAGSAAFVLPFVYGEEFRSAVWPAAWIALGLSFQPAAGIASGFLLGAGRPGLNSLILGAGFGITLVLDLLLIPRHSSLGAAWASAAAYAATDLLLVSAWRHTRGRT